MLTFADRVELAELPARYAMHVDRRDWEPLAELFTADAELLLPDPPQSLAPVTLVAGRPAIIGAMAHLQSIPVTLHAVLGMVIDPAGPGLATGWITGEAHHLTMRGEQQRDLVWYLHYDDEYRQADGHWRIARRSIHVDWIETRPVRSSRADIEELQ